MQYDSAEFRDVFDRYNKFNQNTLQFLVDTGVISEAQREAMNIDYIPYYKYMEQEEYGTGKKMVRNSILSLWQVFNNPDAGIQELTGREGTISDLYENIIKNNNAMIAQIYKNVAIQRALKNMETLEMSRRVTERESGNPAVVTCEDGKSFAGPRRRGWERYRLQPAHVHGTVVVQPPAAYRPDGHRAEGDRHLP